MPSRRYAILALWESARESDFRGDLGSRKYSTMAWLGALTKLDLDHLDLGIFSLLGKTLGIEIAVSSPAAKIPATDFPNEVSAVLSVIRADAALTGVVSETTHPCALVEREDCVCAE